MVNAENVNQFVYPLNCTCYLVFTLNGSRTQTLINFNQFSLQKTKLNQMKPVGLKTQ